MAQKYHNNAKTNINIRQQISKSIASNAALASQFNCSTNTISKWKNQTEFNDKSSRPKRIDYALSELEKDLIISIRKSTWFPLAEIHEMIMVHHPKVSQSSIYRTFVQYKINTVPQEKKELRKKFKEYEPGFLHIDVTYLPKFDKASCYLFVAIDRATRAMYYKVFDNKEAESTAIFMNECIAYFPFEISHVLTDNGLEFTNTRIKSKKGNLCTKPSKLDEICSKEDIDHRLTKPCNPQTNGMVERVNGTIKSNTILAKTYQTKQEMEDDLMKFLAHYNLQRRHGGLVKELKVKSPMQAIEKWYQLKPEIFKEKPDDFKNKILNLVNKMQIKSTTTL